MENADERHDIRVGDAWGVSGLCGVSGEGIIHTRIMLIRAFRKIYLRLDDVIQRPRISLGLGTCLVGIT